MPDDRPTVAFSIGGQLRIRGEGMSHFLSAVGARANDRFYGVARALLHADLQFGAWGRAFAEVRDAYGHSRDLPGGRRPNDHDRTDVQNLWVELRRGDATSSVSARVGRQELLLARERLLGPADWSNVRRTFDAARLTARRGGATVDLIVAHPLALDPKAANAADRATRLEGLVIERAFRDAGGLSTHLYLLRLTQDSVRYAGVVGAHRRLTIGGRFAGRGPSTRGVRTGWELESAHQRGSLGEQKIDAWFAVAEASAQLTRVHGKPTLALGHEAGSGDRDPRDARTGTFHQLFASAHQHGGLLDVIGRPNTQEWRATLTATPHRSLALRGAAHRFARMRAGDAVYGKGGTPLRTAGSSTPSRLGGEFDLTLTWQADRRTKVLAGYGHFAPGPFFRATTGGAHPIDWGFFGTTFSF